MNSKLGSAAAALLFLAFYCATASPLDQVAPKAPEPTVRQLNVLEADILPSPEATFVRPRPLAALGAALISALLFMLYIHRRSAFILQWTFSWLLLSAGLLVLPSPDTTTILALLAPGISQYFILLAALLFWMSADSYRGRNIFQMPNIMTAAILLLWFTVTPLIWGLGSVMRPGYLLIAIALGAAGFSYIRLLRDTRLAGAAVIGLSFLVIALLSLQVAFTLPEVAADGRLALRILLVNTVLYAFVALGMHLLVFEDMNYELRGTNRRLESAQQELLQIASTDPLTGCRNRRFFHEIIPQELENHRRSSTPLSLLFIDLDNLKELNDRHGHDTGDRVLRHVANFLQSQVRAADHVFRWGGDEFLILLSCNGEEALHKAAALKLGFLESLQTTNLPPTGLSVGCSEIKPEVDDVLALIEEADRHMYEDKTSRAILRS